LAWRHAAPWPRKMSATSRAGRAMQARYVGGATIRRVLEVRIQSPPAVSQQRTRSRSNVQLSRVRRPRPRRLSTKSYARSAAYVTSANPHPSTLPSLPKSAAAEPPVSPGALPLPYWGRGFESLPSHPSASNRRALPVWLHSGEPPHCGAPRSMMKPNINGPIMPPMLGKPPKVSNYALEGW
jgi:hypothetical protein